MSVADTGTSGMGSAASRVPPLPVVDFPPASGSALPWGDPVDTSAGGTLLPHVVAWNLTRRCNLECSHCYISAGAWHGTEGELSTAECFRILDDLLAVNPSMLLILSGGEPLLRDDLESIAERAASAGATVVVGTNGIGLTHERIDSLKAAGVRGVAVSVDSLNPTYHDRFRHGVGALEGTLAAVDRLVRHELDFVIQTSLTRGNRDELSDLVAWTAEKGAVSFNLYFLVPTGRGEGMQGLTPRENEEVLAELLSLEQEYRGRLMVRSKCQPQLMRHVLEAGVESGLLNYETRCPCGVHYCRITPEGKVTPCPYLPTVAGDLTRESFREVWTSSPVFGALREGELSGKCGRCEYREVCGGCRARAYAQSGDLLGSDESCVYDPPGDRPLVQRQRPITYGQATETALEWTPEARQRLERIPSFVRGVVTNRVEEFARKRGYSAVDLEVMAEVRRSMPVDFSKKLPFFLRSDDGGGSQGKGVDA
ncbi:MAG: radical SAM protein [Gemmatimonadetes bacterium]|nr:radical SAM protein [Gemmatimonadota bacterium]